MKTGIGLPVSHPGTLLEWARRADSGPFSTLGLLDRLVYDNPEPLVTLAHLAGVTSRVRLQTEVLIAPLHRTALLAKQTATLDRLSGGRFTLGVGLGGREDDYRAAGVEPRRRGRRLDEQLATLRQVWSGAPYGDEEPIGPSPERPGGPEVVIGGFAPAAIERVARWGDGFLGASPTPALMDSAFRAVEKSWRRAERSGRPRLVAQANVALGPSATVQAAETNIRRYYGFLSGTHDMAEGLLSTPAQIRDAITRNADLGADEVMLYCWSADPQQVERLAETVA